MVKKARKPMPKPKAKAAKPAPKGKLVAKKPAPKAKAVPKASKKLIPRRSAAMARPATARARLDTATARPDTMTRPAAPPSPPAPHPIAADVPDYDSLPIREGAPDGSAWGVFGDDDQVGTVNLLTGDRVKQAAAFVRTGKVFALNLPINIPDPPIFTRGKHAHHIKQFNGFILDDYLDNFYPQASSQWDALCHVKHPRHGGYNGFPDHEITGYGGHKLGIDNLARRGIAGRGILADVARYYDQRGKTLRCDSNEVVPLEDLEATLAAQKTEVWPGDVLLMRVGWTRGYLELSDEQKAELARETKTPGLEGSRRSARWLWENHIAAAGSDSPSFEAVPPPDGEFGEGSELLHFHMLSFFGMPIGEMWNLEELADDCARDGRYEFFFTSAPLNIPGGVGSPPNALAIK